jgi:hypothetical protein
VLWWSYCGIVPFGTFDDFWPMLCPIGDALWKPTFAYISWAQLAKIIKFLLWVGLMRLRPIIPVFLIWPTFQGHRGQIGLIGRYLFPEHISLISIDARIFIFWWYDGHSVAMFLLAVSIIVDRIGGTLWKPTYLMNVFVLGWPVKKDITNCLWLTCGHISSIS